MGYFELFADSHCVNVENPLWNETDGKLYWKGSEPGEIFRKALTGDPAYFERLILPVGLIGGFTFMKGGGLLILAQSGKVWRWRDDRDSVTAAELPGADEQTYFNDLIADPEGRVYCGVLAHDFFAGQTGENTVLYGVLIRTVRFIAWKRKPGSVPMAWAFRQICDTFILQSLTRRLSTAMTIIVQMVISATGFL